MKLGQNFQKKKYGELVQFLKDSDAHIIDAINHLAESNAIPKTLVNDMGFFEAVKVRTDKMFAAPYKTGGSLQDFIEKYDYLVDNDLPFPDKAFIAAPFAGLVKSQVRQSIKDFTIQEANERFGRFSDLAVMLDKMGVKYEHHTEPIIMSLEEDYEQGE